MERVAKLVSRTPPEGLTDWAPVRDGLERWGLVYEAVWVPDYGLEVLLNEGARPRKRKAVEVRCSCCGESRIMPWARTDKQHGGYGFLQEDEQSGETALVGSGDESVCPICGCPVRVKKAAEVGQGHFVADETQTMSAAVVGMDRYLVLTGWTIQRRVYRNARAELKVIPAEAYVFARDYCRKLVGWRNSYSGNAGYFITYSLVWSEPQNSWGAEPWEGAKWALEHRGLILAIAAGVGTAVAAYKTYKTALTAYNAAMGVYKIVTAASATGTFTLAGAMTALNIPVLAACAGIGLLVAGGILLYRNWDTVKAKAGELGAAVSAIWSNIDAAVQNAIAAISARFPLLGAVMQGWWKSVGDAGANIQAVFSNIISFIDNVFAGNWSAALENLIYIFGNLFGGLVNLAKAPINGVVSVINSVLGRINNISVTIPEWVPSVGGKTLGFNLPAIPMLASGGIVTAPTILEAGEGGEPEAILPLSRLAALLDNLSGRGRESNHGGPLPANPDGEWPEAPPPPGQPQSAFDQGERIVFSPVLNFYGSAGKQR